MLHNALTNVVPRQYFPISLGPAWTYVSETIVCMYSGESAAINQLCVCISKV